MATNACHPWPERNRQQRRRGVLAYPFAALKKLTNVNDFAFVEGMQSALEIVQVHCIRVRPVPGSTRAPATPVPHAQFKQARYLLPGTQAMNRIFRVVSNDVLALWAVASERGRAHARSTAAKVDGGLAPPAGTAVMVIPGTTATTLAPTSPFL